MQTPQPERAPAKAPPPVEDEPIAVELGGVTRFVQLSTVMWAQAHGDYVRLHTADGSHLVRVSLATLEEQWQPAGFRRIHRSTLIALAHVDEVTIQGGRYTVHIGDHRLIVSRRHARALRGQLMRTTSIGPAAQQSR